MSYKRQHLIVFCCCFCLGGRLISQSNDSLIVIIRLWVLQVPVEEATECFKYDIYLAHSADDLDWVGEELLPLLEGERGLKVFVEARDGEMGNMADNISRYPSFVLSTSQ